MDTTDMQIALLCAKVGGQTTYRGNWVHIGCLAQDRSRVTCVIVVKTVLSSSGITYRSRIFLNPKLVQEI